MGCIGSAANSRNGGYTLEHAFGLNQGLPVSGEPDIARKLAIFFGLLRAKILETQEEREELSLAWDNIWATESTDWDSNGQALPSVVVEPPPTPEVTSLAECDRLIPRWCRE